MHGTVAQSCTTAATQFDFLTYKSAGVTPYCVCLGPDSDTDLINDIWTSFALELGARTSIDWAFSIEEAVQKIEACIPAGVLVLNAGFIAPTSGKWPDFANQAHWIPLKVTIAQLTACVEHQGESWHQPTGSPRAGLA
ncbi:hypothetical protein NQ176_g6465 [Zarea fungicola]|uniref:Uncharacterized protein n=1 Tax=Zarea fungicola TaxID=93591 RepID=A0ACC1N5I7_9HYPO|nr:hypothetical protein NQ176_g6465 [Lecanicillium fungicola]